MSLNELFFKLKGGQGSGNFGHSGRKGKVGGSSGNSVVLCPVGVRCTVATLNALGVETDKSKKYTYGTSVVSAIQGSGKKWKMVNLPKRTTVKNFVDNHQTGKYYISTTDHAMALVEGVLTDTEGKGLNRRIITIAMQVFDS